jgi:predicted metal-binding membrane protein
MAMDMEGMSASGSMMTLRPWTSLDFTLTFAMWTVMMVGMMVPSATPTALIYAAVARKAARQGAVLAPTIIFVSGYVAVWTVFSLLATVIQWGLERAALLSPMMASTSPSLGAALLVGAGVYQLTPMKAACLRHCRAPAQFISEHWRPGRAGAFQMGIIHGAYCLGCCWILMGLLFFGGVMNLLWIAAITITVLAEKVLPFGNWAGRIAGAAAVAVGVAVLVG